MAERQIDTYAARLGDPNLGKATSSEGRNISRGDNLVARMTEVMFWLTSLPQI